MEQGENTFSIIKDRRKRDIEAAVLATQIRLGALTKLGSDKVEDVLEGVKALRNLQEKIASGYLQRPMTREELDTFTADLVAFVIESRKGQLQAEGEVSILAWGPEQITQFSDLVQKEGLIKPEAAKPTPPAEGGK